MLVVPSDSGAFITLAMQQVSTSTDQNPINCILCEVATTVSPVSQSQNDDTDGSDRSAWRRSWWFMLDCFVKIG